MIWHFFICFKPSPESCRKCIVTKRKLFHEYLASITLIVGGSVRLRGGGVLVIHSPAHTHLTPSAQWMQLDNPEQGELLPSREHHIKRGLAKRCLQILITTQLTAKEIKENEHRSDSHAETITQTTG